MQSVNATEHAAGHIQWSAEGSMAGSGSPALSASSPSTLYVKLMPFSVLVPAYMVNFVVIGMLAMSLGLRAVLY